MNKIYRELGDFPCRRCINKKFDVRLEPKDCIYLENEDYCSYCKNIRHIVVGLKMSGKIKMMFKK